MALKETAYAKRLHGLGFTLMHDRTVLQFEVDGILVEPVGKVYARIESPDHLTIVQDANGYLYRVHELIPSQHLEGRDVTTFIAARLKKTRVHIPLERIKVASAAARRRSVKRRAT